MQLLPCPAPQPFGTTSARGGKHPQPASLPKDGAATGPWRGASRAAQKGGQEGIFPTCIALRIIGQQLF